VRDQPKSPDHNLCRNSAYSSRLLRIALLLIFAGIVATLPVSTSGQSADSLYNDAGKAYDSGDIKRAIDLYEQLVRMAPNSVQARTNLGVALAHEGRYADAIAQYREALKQDPENPTVRLDLALASYKQADFAKAATELELLRKKHSENKQTLYLLADCYLRLGKYRATIQLLDPVYQSSPDDLAVDYALGTALIQNGQMKRGEIVIDRVLKNGNSAEANLLIGAAQFAAGDFKKAAETLNRALQANPNLPGGWTIYGRALIGSGDNEGAKSALRHALDADPNDFDANLRLGGMLRHDGENDAAAPYLTRALQLRPESAPAQLQMGALNASTGHLEEARKQLEAVAKRWPDFLEAHVQLASLYARMNLPEESAHERKIVLALNAKARREGPQPQE